MLNSCRGSLRKTATGGYRSVSRRDNSRFLRVGVLQAGKGVRKTGGRLTYCRKGDKAARRNPHVLEGTGIGVEQRPSRRLYHLWRYSRDLEQGGIVAGRQGADECPEVLRLQAHWDDHGGDVVAEMVHLFDEEGVVCPVGLG